MAKTIYDQETDSVLNEMQELLKANREPKIVRSALTRSIPSRKKNKSFGIDLVHSLRIQLRSLGGLGAPEFPTLQAKKVVLKSIKRAIPSRAKEPKIAPTPQVESAPEFELTPVQKIIRDGNLQTDPAEEKIGSKLMLEPLIIPPRRRERKPRKKRQVNILKKVRIQTRKKKNVRNRINKKIPVRAKKKPSRARQAMKKLSGKEKLIMALMNVRSRKK